MGLTHNMRGLFIALDSMSYNLRLFEKAGSDQRPLTESDRIFINKYRQYFSSRDEFATLGSSYVLLHGMNFKSRDYAILKMSLVLLTHYVAAFLYCFVMPQQDETPSVGDMKTFLF